MRERDLMPDATLFGPDRHVFVSPHYDDIPLSCGGTLARITDAGRAATIRIVFGAAPTTPLTDFALAQHQRWGVSAEDVIRTRQAEETAASVLLGAEWSTLPHADAIYRGERYRCDAQLFGTVASDEAPLIAAIAAALAGDAAGGGRAVARYYVPLGVGNHVDHQLCHAVGRALAAGGAEVWCYEDLPYALLPAATDQCLARLAAVSPPAPRPLPWVSIANNWERKLAAVLAYPSQVPNIFRTNSPTANPAEITAALAAGALDDGGLVERYWRLPVTPDAVAGGEQNKVELGY